MRKNYLFTLTVLAAASTSTLAATPLMKEIHSPSNRILSLQQAGITKKAAAKAAEESSWGEWQPAGTGTFTIDDGLAIYLGLEEWTGSFEGIQVYSRSNSENASSLQFRLEGVYNGADIIVDYDANTSLCKVNPQPTNIEAYDMPLDVIDFGTLFELHGEDWLGMTPEETEEIASEYGSYNYFIPELGRFYLYLGYITEGIEDALAITDCTFQLDDAEDMSVSVKADAFYKDIAEMNGSVTFPSSVVECRYGCFEGILTQDKINYVLNNSEGVNRISNAGQVELSAEQGPGLYTIVAITFAENGTPLEWDYAEYTYTPSSNEGWTSLGEGEFKTDMFESLFDINVPSYKVEVEINNDNPLLYRVVNPYGADCPYPELSIKAETEGFDTYLVFDATDAERVFFKPTNLGIDTGGGWWIAVNDGYFTEEIDGKNASSSSFGSLKDNVISFPKNSVIVTCSEISIFGGEDGNWYYGNSSGSLSLTLPAGSGVDSATTEANSKREYFNLQGVRLTAPENGTMVIERNGSKVTKKVIR